MCDCGRRHALRDSLGRFRRHGTPFTQPATRARRDYALYLEARYAAAEAATRGHLLTREGLARNVRPSRWFEPGKTVNARYASEELTTWLVLHPLLSRADYLAQVLEAVA